MIDRSHRHSTASEPSQPRRTLWSGIAPGVRSVFPFSFGARFSDAADRHHMTSEHCALYLARRIGTAREARKRQGNWFGRVSNLMRGDDPDFVTLTGHVLVVSSRRANLMDGVEVNARGVYAIKLERAVELYDGLMATIQTERGT